MDRPKTKLKMGSSESKVETGWPRPKVKTVLIQKVNMGPNSADSTLTEFLKNKVDRVEILKQAGASTGVGINGIIAKRGKVFVYWWLLQEIMGVPYQEEVKCVPVFKKFKAWVELQTRKRIEYLNYANNVKWYHLWAPTVSTSKLGAKIW